MDWEQREGLAAKASEIWRRKMLRSGMVPGVALGLLVIGLLIAYRERGRGDLHRLEQKMVTAPLQQAPTPRPGGQDPVVLTRSRLAGGSTPEFLGVTMLPGRGMNVLQIMAYIPSKGDVNLLDAPAPEQAAAAMNGLDGDENGAASLKMGGAFEVPWAGELWGAPSSSGHLAATWRSHTLLLPALLSPNSTIGGLLLAMPAESSTSTAMPDGGQGDATFAAGDFGAHWPSKTEVKTSVLLTGRSIELTVTARNTGDAAEPVGIGWRPRFVLLGDRSQIELHIPGTQRILRDPHTGQPTGQLQPVSGTPYDFTARDGAKLGATELDDTFVQLHRDFLESGPIAEMRDPANNYGLRITTLTGTIKALHVFTKKGANYLSIAPQDNYDDPFGREWTRAPDNGVVVLQPGQSTQWEIRLEVFALAGEPSPF